MGWLGMSGRRRNFWAVIATKSISGAEAARQITNQGFECYRPLYREPPRRGVRRVASLFPGYVFAHVRVSRDWKPLASTRDVRRVLMADAVTPARVSDHEIASIRSLENEHGFIEPQFAEAPRFTYGERVQATGGFFRDQFGIYVGLVSESGRRRVRVLFEILGRRQQFEISAFDLGRVAT